MEEDNLQSEKEAGMIRAVAEVLFRKLTRHLERNCCFRCPAAEDPDDLDVHVSEYNPTEFLKELREFKSDEYTSLPDNSVNRRLVRREALVCAKENLCAKKNYLESKLQIQSGRSKLYQYMRWITKSPKEDETYKEQLRERAKIAIDVKICEMVIEFLERQLSF